MNKKHIIRGFIISAVMSLTVCSAAYATTVSRSEKVRNKSSYNNSLTTSAATYTATGTY